MEVKLNTKKPRFQKNLQMSYKGDYAHFTLKEISEQPTTIVQSRG